MKKSKQEQEARREEASLRGKKPWLEYAPAKQIVLSDEERERFRRYMYECLGSDSPSGPEAVRERHMALDNFQDIGEKYYYHWLETGMVLPEALEDCIEAKQHKDAAERLEAEFKQKQQKEAT